MSESIKLISPKGEINATSIRISFFGQGNEIQNINWPKSSDLDKKSRSLLNFALSHIISVSTMCDESGIPSASASIEALGKSLIKGGQLNKRFNDEYQKFIIEWIRPKVPTPDEVNSLLKEFGF